MVWPETMKTDGCFARSQKIAAAAAAKIEIYFKIRICFGSGISKNFTFIVLY